MSAYLVLDALGASLRLDLGELPHAQRRAVREAWADAEAPAHHPSVLTLRFGPDPDTDRLLATVSQRVTRAALDARRGAGWMLHAAAVARDDGSVVVLVGPSGAGKTTAAQALGRRWGYVSDEAVLITPRGDIHPFRKPLSVAGAPGGVKTQVAPSSQGLRGLPDPELHVAAIVLLDRRSDPGVAASAVPVDLADALPELVAQSSHLTTLRAPLQSIAAIADRAGGIHRVTYRESGELRALLEPLAGIGATTTASPPSPSRAGGVPASGDGTGPRFVRAAHRDALALPGRVAVLAGDELRMLDGVAPALWRAAERPLGMSGLVDAVVAEHGHPDSGDPAERVGHAVATLVAEGVLREARHWTIAPDVAWTGDAGRVVAMPLDDRSTPQPVALEGSAAAVWAALAASPGIEIEQLREAVARDFRATPADIAADVDEFLAGLERARLIAAC